MFACRTMRALVARLGLATSLTFVAAVALAQSYSDVGGTRIPAFALLGGCVANGACAGPNAAADPLFVAPAADSVVAPAALTAANQAVAVSVQGMATVAFDVTTNTNVTLAFEGLASDGATWGPVDAYAQQSGAVVSGVTSGTTGKWLIPAAGYQQIRARVSAVGATPSAIVSAEASPAGSWQAVARLLQAPLSAGANLIGKVGLDQTTPGATNGVTLRPAALTGAYAMAVRSGTMAAALGAAAPIASFRYGGAGLATIRRIEISAGDLVGFTAGLASFDLYAARAFTASDSGGNAATLTGNAGKLATSHATTSVADFRVSSTAALTPGTRTLDGSPLVALATSVAATAGQPITSGVVTLYNAGAAEYPLVLANNEGFVIQATVPATGTWDFAVRVIWDESASYP